MQKGRRELPQGLDVFSDRTVVRSAQHTLSLAHGRARPTSAEEVKGRIAAGPGPWLCRESRLPGCEPGPGARCFVQGPQVGEGGGGSGHSRD